MFLLLFYLGGAFANLDWLWISQATSWEPVDRVMFFLGVLVFLSIDISMFIAIREALGE